VTTIGEFTLSGTYNLLLLGAAVGLIGAALYRLVAPWLIGPTWFRRVTVGLACAAVVGAILVHDDGIDFHLLEPTWLAIGLFVAVPGLFGLLIGARGGSGVARRRTLARRQVARTTRGRSRGRLPADAVRGRVPHPGPVVRDHAAPGRGARTPALVDVCRIRGSRRVVGARCRRSGGTHPGCSRDCLNSGSRSSCGPGGRMPNDGSMPDAARKERNEWRVHDNVPEPIGRITRVARVAGESSWR
jgi:hypothetical protein